MNYFAKLNGQEFTSELKERIEFYYQQLRSSKVYKKIKKSYAAYYSGGGNVYSHDYDDKSSELKISHYRNLIQHKMTLTTNERSQFQARAINSDHKSMTQTTLAQGLLDYYMTEKSIENKLKISVEYALVTGVGYISLRWDETKGEQFSVDEKKRVVYEGDIVPTNLSLLDVIIDPTKKDYDDITWYIERDFVNRYDLAAKYKRYADQILNIEDDDHDTLRNPFTSGNIQKEDIRVYTFYHKETEALPGGRQTVFVGDDIILSDGTLPYRDLPLYRITDGEILGSVWGYSSAFDCIPIQEALNDMSAIVFSNILNYGPTNVLAPKGSGLSLEKISEGFNIFEYEKKSGKIEALNLTSTPAEVFTFMKELEHVMEILMGISSVSRGRPDASLKSGAALALVQSQSLQFASGLQHNYSRLLSQIGTGIINLLQDFANVPRMAMIVGKNKSPMFKQFVSNDLDQIKRVVVDEGNPLSKTTAGKVQLGDNLLAKGMLRTPEEYISVLTTGQLDTLLEGEQSELLLIRDENEMLTEGKDVNCLSIDMHELHIREHKNIFSNPEVRRSSPEILQKALEHITDHVELLKTTDPELLIITGQKPLAPQVPQEEIADSGEVLSSDKQNVEMDKMPNFPTNPLSGETWEPQAGGLN